MSDLDDFVQMSVLLTGFNQSVIAPALDPIDLKTVIFNYAVAHADPAFTQLVQIYATLAAGKPVSEMTPAERQAIGDQLLGINGRRQDANIAATARSVMLAWYLGSWYQPFDNTIDGQPVAAGTQTVISDQAYIGGLSWKAMQSHAMGNSTFTFGYWAETPPPLAAFTGNTPSGGNS